MRRSLFALVLFSVLLSGEQAAAIKLMLAYPAVLRAGPEEHYAAIGTAPAGDGSQNHSRRSELDAHRDRQQTLFVATVELVFMSSRVTETSGCDFGYPYSGGNQYFASPLVELRHSWPLGDLLGYHTRRPC